MPGSSLDESHLIIRTHSQTVEEAREWASCSAAEQHEYLSPYLSCFKSIESIFALHSDYRRDTRDCKGVHMATNPGRDSLETQQLHLTHRTRQ
jgi:hypothetical protein